MLVVRVGIDVPGHRGVVAMLCNRVVSRRRVVLLLPRRALLNALSHIRDGDLLTVQEVDRLGRNLLEGLIALNDLFQQGVGVKVLEGIAAGEHTERSLILDLALALAEDRRRDGEGLRRRRPQDPQDRRGQPHRPAPGSLRRTR